VTKTFDKGLWRQTAQAESPFVRVVNVGWNICAAQPIILYPVYLIVSLLEGKNDGWISFSSATRDNTTKTIFADHVQQAGHDLPSIEGNERPGFNHLEFYERIVTEVRQFP
jgi:hypothetical protein